MDLEQQILDTKGELAEAISTYGPNSPWVRPIREQLAALMALRKRG